MLFQILTPRQNDREDALRWLREINDWRWHLQDQIDDDAGEQLLSQYAEAKGELEKAQRWAYDQNADCLNHHYIDEKSAPYNRAICTICHGRTVLHRMSPLPWPGGAE